MNKTEKNIDRLIAVYGTLRKGYGNHRLIAHCKPIGIGWTKEKYKLTASGIPFVDKDSKISKVRVEIFKIKAEDMPRVDSLEGHPRWYRREPITVELDDGSDIEAELYFNKQEGSILIKSGDYNDYK